MDDFGDSWAMTRPVPVYDRDDGVRFEPGSRVRLRPAAGADIFDLALAGMIALIETIEQDFEGQFFFGVTVEDDPGRDLGQMGKPGHRFFFRPEEVEWIGPPSPGESRP